MRELLLAGLERRSPRVCRVVVAIGALLALAAVMAALTLTNPHGSHKRRPPEQRPADTEPARARCSFPRRQRSVICARSYSAIIP